jgi:hypothetical protein
MSGSIDPPFRGDPAAAGADALEFRAPRAVVADGPATDALLSRGLGPVVGLLDGGRLSPRRAARTSARI